MPLTSWRTIHVAVPAIALLCAAVGRPEAIQAQSTLQLSVVLSNSSSVVTWSDPAALLQSSLSLAGSWITLSNAASPYRAPTTNSLRFFRLRLDCVSLPGIVSWWTGDGTAADHVGTNQGSLMAGGTYAQGEVRQAFSFDGTSGWVDIPNSASLNPTGPFSAG